MSHIWQLLTSFAVLTWWKRNLLKDSNANGILQQWDSTTDLADYELNVSDDGEPALLKCGPDIYEEDINDGNTCYDLRSKGRTDLCQNIIGIVQVFMIQNAHALQRRNWENGFGFELCSEFSQQLLAS